MANLESWALANNPTLQQARANITASEGRALQAGLRPNPILGYVGQQIGSGGSGGQQGMFFEQLVVTGNKLQLNRLKFVLEMQRMRWEYVAQQHRVATSVRMQFYRVLAIQHAVTLEDRLARETADVDRIVARLKADDKLEEADVLEARLQASRQDSEREDVQHLHQQAWRELASLCGIPNLPSGTLAGELDAPGLELSWEAELARLLAESPEMRIAATELQYYRAAVRREQAEPAPNLNVVGGTQYNFETGDQQAQAELGFQIPIFDRNQGNIRTANAEVMRARAEIQRVEASLHKRLAFVFNSQRGARDDVRQHRQEWLPLAQRAYELRLASLRAGKGQWTDLHDAQRTYIELNTEYLNRVLELRRAETVIAGLLLVDGIDSEPPESPSEDRPRRDDVFRELRENLQEPIAGRGARSVEDRVGHQLNR
jgi:cobalt-zinc-cadmium efflux system outer membrane protein